MSLQNVYSKNITGMLAFTGNTLGLDGSCTSFPNKFTGCDTHGISGLCGTWVTTDTTSYASSNWLSFVNSLPLSTTNGGTTFDYTQNSSSGVLSIPPNVSIDYAVLVWAGNNGGNNVSTLPIKLTVPTGTTLNISPDLYFSDADSDGYYTCSKDVTSIISTYLSGTYTCGSVYSVFAANAAVAGWQLIAVYKSNTNTYVNISINVGYLDVDSSESVSQTISGFSTAEQGFTISAGALITALRGNPATAGDNISITNGNGVPTLLYGPYNPVNNFFGCQIMDITGGICETGTFGNLNATPNSIQTVSGNRAGFDIALVNLANALSPLQTSTTLTASTIGNPFYVPSFTSIIVNGSANIGITTSSSISSISIGDSYTLTYTLTNNGTGSTQSNNFTFSTLDGLDFISGYYSLQGSGVTIPISSNPSNLALTSNINPNESIVVSLNYNTATIPTDLYYINNVSDNYSFLVGTDTINNSISAEIPIDINFEDTITVNDGDPYTFTLPIVNPSSSNISYTIKLNPSHGSLHVSTQGVVLYTPNTVIQGYDRFIITATNSSTSKSIDLVYNVNLTITIELTINYTNSPAVLTLGDMDTFTYEISNNSQFNITNLNILPTPSTGFLFSSAKYTLPDGSSRDLIATSTGYILSNIDSNSTISVNTVYKGIMIPTCLYYQNYTLITYSFSNLNFSNSDYSAIVPIIAIVNLNLSNTAIYSKFVPVTNPSYSYLSYSIKTQGSLGSANISSSGLLTYTPIISSSGLDTVIVTVNNSQLNTTLDITYNFDIINGPLPPTNTSLSDKLLSLLENDLFMGRLSNSNIKNICFDCNIYNNGYSSNTSLVINPIKPTLLNILNDLVTYLKDILSPVSLNTCNDLGFKSQVDRFLNIILDLQNSINVLTCDINCCNISLVNQLFSLLSQTIIYLINIITNISGAILYCNSNCSSCSNSLDSFMFNIVNGVTSLSSIMNNWHALTLSFMSCSNNIYKPYVASYIPTLRR